MQGKKLIQADALAERYDVTRWRIYQLVRSGQIPAVRLGRTVRFDPDALEAWEARGGTAGTDDGLRTTSG